MAETSPPHPPPPLCGIVFRAREKLFSFAIASRLSSKMRAPVRNYFAVKIVHKVYSSTDEIAVREGLKTVNVSFKLHAATFTTRDSGARSSVDNKREREPRVVEMKITYFKQIKFILYQPMTASLSLSLFAFGQKLYICMRIYNSLSLLENCYYKYMRLSLIKSQAKVLARLFFIKLAFTRQFYELIKLPGGRVPRAM